VVSIKAVTSLSVLFAVIIAGTVGFKYIEREQRLSWADSLYFTIVTITTVGYGDLHPQTEAGRLFAIPVIVMGVSSALSTLTFLFGSLVEERIRTAISGLGRVREMEDHVIICGAGPLADVVAEELQLNNMPHVRILSEAPSEAKNVVVGDASEEEVLRRAGVEKAMSLVTLLDDADNAFVVLEAKRLNPSIRTIAVVKDPVNQERLDEIGTDLVVVPDLVSARLLALSSESHFSLGFFDRELSARALTLGEISVLSEGPLVGRSISDLDLPRRFGVSVVAVSQGRELNPSPDPERPLEPGAQIIVLGDRSNVHRLRQWAAGTHGEAPRMRRVEGHDRQSLAREVRLRMPRIAKNLFLVFMVIVVRFLISPVFSAAGLAIHMQSVFMLALDVATWAAAGYLVFIMIQDLRALAELGVINLHGLPWTGEGGRMKRFARNISYLIVILILGTIVAPMLGSMKGIPKLIGMAVPWVCLGLLLLVLYDAGSFAYSLLELTARRLAERFEKELREAS